MAPQIRAPAVAGMFYPGGRNELQQLVAQLLRAASSKPSPTAPKAIIAPHAGYVYSGAVAASAFKLFEPIANQIRRFVLIGPAHRVYLEGVAAPAADALATPLGLINVDKDALALVPEVLQDARAHAREHSLEVELPFLQELAPNATVVPLVVGHTPPALVGSILERLWGGPETRIVVSSDLSHYLPYEQGKKLDGRTARRICDLGSHPIGPDEACGAAGVNGLTWLALRKNLRAEILDLRSSGDTAGPRDEVVGYGAFAFYEEQAQPS